MPPDAVLPVVACCVQVLHLHTVPVNFAVTLPRLPRSYLDYGYFTTIPFCRLYHPHTITAAVPQFCRSGWFVLDAVCTYARFAGLLRAHAPHGLRTHVVTATHVPDFDFYGLLPTLRYLLHATAFTRLLPVAVALHGSLPDTPRYCGYTPTFIFALYTHRLHTAFCRLPVWLLQFCLLRLLRLPRLQVTACSLPFTVLRLRFTVTVTVVGFAFTVYVYCGYVTRVHIPVTQRLRCCLFPRCYGYTVTTHVLPDYGYTHGYVTYVYRGYAYVVGYTHTRLVRLRLPLMPFVTLRACTLPLRLFWLVVPVAVTHVHGYYIRLPRLCRLHAAVLPFTFTALVLPRSCHYRTVTLLLVLRLHFTLRLHTRLLRHTAVLVYVTAVCCARCYLYVRLLYRLFTHTCGCYAHARFWVLQLRYRGYVLFCLHLPVCYIQFSSRSFPILRSTRVYPHTPTITVLRLHHTPAHRTTHRGSTCGCCQLPGSLRGCARGCAFVRGSHRCGWVHLPFVPGSVVYRAAHCRLRCLLRLRLVCLLRFTFAAGWLHVTPLPCSYAVTLVPVPAWIPQDCVTVYRFMRLILYYRSPCGYAVTVGYAHDAFTLGYRITPTPAVYTAVLICILLVRSRLPHTTVTCVYVVADPALRAGCRYAVLVAVGSAYYRLDSVTVLVAGSTVPVTYIWFTTALRHTTFTILYYGLFSSPLIRYLHVLRFCYTVACGSGLRLHHLPPRTVTHTLRFCRYSGYGLYTTTPHVCLPAFCRFALPRTFTGYLLPVTGLPFIRTVTHHCHATALPFTCVVPRYTTVTVVVLDCCYGLPPVTGYRLFVPVTFYGYTPLLPLLCTTTVGHICHRFVCWVVRSAVGYHIPFTGSGYGFCWLPRLHSLYRVTTYRTRILRLLDRFHTRLFTFCRSSGSVAAVRLRAVRAVCCAARLVRYTRVAGLPRSGLHTRLGSGYTHVLVLRLYIVAFCWITARYRLRFTVTPFVGLRVLRLHLHALHDTTHTRCLCRATRLRFGCRSFTHLQFPDSGYIPRTTCRSHTRSAHHLPRSTVAPPFTLPHAYRIPRFCVL